MARSKPREFNAFMVENIDKIDLLLKLIDEATKVRDELNDLLKKVEISYALGKERR